MNCKSSSAPTLQLDPLTRSGTLPCPGSLLGTSSSSSTTLKVSTRAGTVPHRYHEAPATSTRNKIQGENVALGPVSPRCPPCHGLIGSRRHSECFVTNLSRIFSNLFSVFLCFPLFFLFSFFFYFLFLFSFVSLFFLCFSLFSFFFFSFLINIFLFFSVFSFFFDEEGVNSRVKVRESFKCFKSFNKSRNQKDNKKREKKRKKKHSQNIFARLIRAKRILMRARPKRSTYRCPPEIVWNPCTDDSGFQNRSLLVYTRNTSYTTARFRVHHGHWSA